jgi:hypothetical protein
MKPGTFAWSLVAGAALLISGCSMDREERPDARPTAVPRLGAHAPAAAAPAAGDLKFTAPEGWISEPPTSAMRKAQYRLPRASGDPEDGELVVFYFQGQGGSVQANIDRWIGQFRKADGSPASGTAKVSKKTVQAIPLTIVDVGGTYSGAGMGGPMTQSTAPKSDFRMLAAVAETASGPWFFKLTGPARTVTHWEPSFQSFLETIR